MGFHKLLYEINDLTFVNVIKKRWCNSSVLIAVMGIIIKPTEKVLG